MMEYWNSLDEHIRAVIQLAAFLTAIVLIYTYAGKVWTNMRNGWNKFAWLFSEQHEHATILKTLDEIKSQFYTNGGTSLKDDITIIKNTLDFTSSYMRVINHGNMSAIFETNAAGGVTFVNRAFVRMTGFSKHEVMGSGWVNLIRPNQRDKVRVMWSSAVKEVRDFDEHIEYVHPDGTPYSVHAIAHVIKDHKGNMLGHFGTITPEEDDDVLG